MTWKRLIHCKTKQPTRMNKKFCNILEYVSLQHVWPMRLKPCKVLPIVYSIVVVGALTCCALLHSVHDLKAAQMSVECSLIHELMFYKFELGHIATEATKNICGVKGEGAVDHSADVSRNFMHVAKTLMIRQHEVGQKVMIPRPFLEANLESSAGRASGELSISQSSETSLFHNLRKSLWSCWIVPHTMKI